MSEYKISPRSLAEDLRVMAATAEASGQPGEAGSLAEAARILDGTPDLLALAYQYRDDMRYVPPDDSRKRRIAAIDATIAKATQP